MPHRHSLFFCNVLQYHPELGFQSNTGRVTHQANRACLERIILGVLSSEYVAHV